MHLPTILNIFWTFLCWNRLFVAYSLFNLWKNRLRTIVNLNFLLRRELSIWDWLLLCFSAITKLLCQKEILFFLSERWLYILIGSGRLFSFKIFNRRVTPLGFLFKVIELLFDQLILLVKLFKLFMILNLSFTWKILLLRADSWNTRRRCSIVFNFAVLNHFANSSRRW